MVVLGGGGGGRVNTQLVIHVVIVSGSFSSTYKRNLSDVDVSNNRYRVGKEHGELIKLNRERLINATVLDY